MKQKFSKNWKSSKQPRKQRKYLFNSPLHIKKKLLSVNLAKDLRKKYGKRNVVVRKGDIVKVLRGKFKKKQGKVTSVNVKLSKLIIEGIQVQKRDGSKTSIKMRPSNLQIVELNEEDKKRLKNAEKREKTEESKKNEKESSAKLKNKEKENKNALKKTKST
ncbi:50S ribosomal protein L24 [Candidatus Pacearchaeota archaeon CG10_big_fil_rev_8_21_14_0_10_34_12]|nr:MAG: 50S ribosomal protein L24 [Candidatus Pacearchaeota archaeon CG10_big_fil_rev_8_21_14_0_10_34_12]